MKTVRRAGATVLSLSTEDLSRPPQVKAAFDEILTVLGQRAASPWPACVPKCGT